MLRPSPATEPTRIAVSAGETRARVDLAVGMLAPRVVERGPRNALIAVAAAQMLLLDGDELVIDVDVGAGCTLEVEDVGGTVAYPGVSSWRLAARIGEAGRLIWRGLPFVVASGARARRLTEITLESGAAVLLRDTIVLGRHGETGGEVVSETRIQLDGHPALVECLAADAALPETGVLGANRVLDSVVATGYRPPPRAGALVLDAPGAIARYLGENTHSSRLDEVWESWRGALTGAPSGRAEGGTRTHTPLGTGT